ncbi:helix-turn-helix transcriptional regulator [Streptomyces verrucosisporus]|uniref:PadR family transcriptional regulator n=1 Tax=Streptomyces verrucosisporus TaxID=1695161 RepID=UPI0019D00E7D|nr:PadR family transcriptional regulator [Streptomyces verrucosisporus]MBN3932168.1 helix-turn-helix transcriptional regulator [Streptomyces verrucosisporus]
MPPVFAHGRLRLYLLKLLDEAPRHGYEVIRLLEERFQGLYAPSAGTVYPRLAKLEAEGLVSHTTEGGRKVYSLTDAGRAELADRQGELTDLELEIHRSLAALAADIREDVSGAAGDLRREMREAAERTRGAGRAPGAEGGEDSGGGGTSAPGWEKAWESIREGSWGDEDSLRAAREEMRRAGEQWKEQARRARQEAQQARLQARRARQARDAARQEAERIARQVQEQVQSHAQRGDWQGAVRAGMSELGRHLGGLGGLSGLGDLGGAGGRATPRPKRAEPDERTDAARAAAPGWAEEPATPSGDPRRDLERLLDRFRDDVRDAARDHGVDEERLREARRHLSTAAARIVSLLRPPGTDGRGGPGA